MTIVLNTLKMSGAEQYLLIGLRRLVCSPGVCVLMALAVAGQDFAQAASGTAIAVVQSASAKEPAGSRILKPVFTGDRISTRSVEAPIRFHDGTRLVVGPNSSLVIDRSGFAEDRTTREVGMSFTKGTLRVISGDSAKQTYSIRTPTGTITFRGTVFSVKESFGPDSTKKLKKLIHCKQGKQDCKGSNGKPRDLTRRDLASRCAGVFHRPARYSPDTVAVCRLLSSL